jgi:hypothetical protein
VRRSETIARHLARSRKLGLPVVCERTILCLVDPRIPRAAKRGPVRLTDGFDHHADPLALEIGDGRIELDDAWKEASSGAPTGAEPGVAGVPRLELAAPSVQSVPGSGGTALARPAEVVPASTLVATGAAAQVAPNILSVAHWERLLGGELYAPLSRVDWALLLRRTFEVDVKCCRNCGGRSRRGRPLPDDRPTAGPSSSASGISPPTHQGSPFGASVATRGPLPWLLSRRTRGLAVKRV